LALPRSLLLGLLGQLGLIAIATAASVTPPVPATEPGRALSPAAAEALYRNAVNEARAGQLERSLSTLQALVERFPARQDMLGDYVVVLGWAGDDAAALDLLAQVRLAEAPPYVIESLANSARRLQRYPLAESLYRDELQRFPGRLEAQLGQVRLQLDTHDIAGATTAIAALRARYPAHSDVLIVFAEVALARRDYFAALTAYQAVLDKQPAQQIRWGTIDADSGRGSARFARLEQALADSELAGAPSTGACPDLDLFSDRPPAGVLKLVRLHRNLRTSRTA
jgi:predicted Zn-dependent protease